MYLLKIYPHPLFFVENNFQNFRGFDSGVAGDLTKILSDAGQEVPDFLGSDMSGFASGGGGGFGGSDIRKGQEQVTNDDEGW